MRIDLRPGSTTNQVNTNANQLVPVAILSDPGFDAPSDVDIASVRAHGAEALQTRFDRSDVDRDGLMDLTVYFRARDFDKPTQEECDDPAAVFTLTGATYDGFRFIGRDRVDFDLLKDLLAPLARWLAGAGVMVLVALLGAWLIFTGARSFTSQGAQA